MVNPMWHGIVDSAAHALGHPALAGAVRGVRGARGIAGYADGGPVAPPDPAMQAPPPDGNSVSPLAQQDPRIGAIADAEDALGHVEDGGQLQDTHVAALNRFASLFGQNALQHLHANVKSGMSMRPRKGRVVHGPGGPHDDQVPAVIDGKHPAKLSSGEFVMPTDAVAGAGGGDPVMGAKRLQDLSTQLAAMQPVKQAQQMAPAQQMQAMQQMAPAASMQPPLPGAGG